MSFLTEVEVRTRSVERFASVLSAAEMEKHREMTRAVRARMEGHVVWQVNSTAVGGGVAEMVRQHVGYSRGAGVDSRWIVISGTPDFFRITKRLHHALHGGRGDGTPLGREERQTYEEVLQHNAAELCQRLRPKDVVALHDPQTAGLAPHLLDSGALLTWRCHIGCDHPNAEVERAWSFLAPYLKDVPLLSFSRPSYVPSVFDPTRVRIVPPSIDPFSPKNRDLAPGSVPAILSFVGILSGPSPDDPSLFRFERSDGTPGRVERRAGVLRAGEAPTPDTPLVVQVSRWDPLKDPIGVMRGFTVGAEAPELKGARLVLAGPDVRGISDDPEGAETFDQVVQVWRELPSAARDRIDLVSLPTEDGEENAVTVNALQRHARIVVQKSLQEGFGLTVAEAMWKGRPVVASAVGGIQDQIENGVSGLLIEDPHDLEAFAAALRSALGDPALARRLGEAAREQVRSMFLDTRTFFLQSETVMGHLPL
jgi:trehalose synthase